MKRIYRMLLKMMTPRERKRFWLLVGVTFVLAALEVATVASILPFLHLLANPDLVETNAVLAWAFSTFNFEDRQSFLTAAGIAVFAITVVGLALKMVAVWVTTRFALMRSYSFSARLLSGYLHQPYEWFLSRHSSDLGKTILSEVDRVVNQALLPAMRLVPEVFTVVLLISALCLAEPEIALIGALLLGGFYGLVFWAVRGVLGRIGVVRVQMNKTRFHVLQEATGGVKELKIMGLEQGFLGRFRRAAYRMAEVQTEGQVISVLPRYALEAIAFGGMVLLILVLMARGDGDITEVIPTLGLIAVVGLRLIPALQQLYMRVSTLRESEATLELIYKDMVELDTERPEVRACREATPLLPLKDTLVLENVAYTYPCATQAALNGLNLTVQANTTVGVVGGTGAGKTTLIDTVLGLLEPSSGEMRIDGTAVTPETRRAWQKTLGYVPQTIFLSDASVAENIAFGVPKEDIDMDAVEQAARIAALHDFIMSEMPKGYDTDVGERGVRLSGGQRQRVGIARALYNAPSTLILDEATSALDTLTEAAVMEAVSNMAGQKTIIMIAHRLSTVRNCDRIFLMRNGVVAASGQFNELVAGDEEFRRMASGLSPTG